MMVHREDPIVVVDLRGSEGMMTTPEALDRPIAALDSAVRELDSFGLLVLAGGDDRAPRTPSEVRRRWRSWVKSRSSELSARCTGVALVTTSRARLVLLRLSEPAIRRMFHAPSRPFMEEASARSWLSKRVAKSAAHAE